jgi:hypothetical protein
MDEQILELMPDVSFRATGDTGIIIMKNSGHMYSINETGTSFFRYLKERQSIDATIARLEAEYDIEPGVLRQDIESLIAGLIRDRVVRFINVR